LRLEKINQKINAEKKNFSLAEKFNAFFGNLGGTPNLAYATV